MPDEPDVTHSDPSPDPDPVATDSSPVTQDVPEGDDRPLLNRIAEIARKQERQEKLMADIAAYMATLGQAQPAYAPQPQPVAQGQPSDEELAQAAQQGNWQAGAILSARIAERTAQATMAQGRREQAVMSRVTGLANKYPGFSDVNSPLHQATLRQYQVLVAQGYHPQSWETRLKAMEDAIVDNPDLVAQAQSRPAVAGELSRQSAVAGHAPVEGTGRRPNASGRTTQPAWVNQTTPTSVAMAKRMGVKDPQKAKERYRQRLTQGSAKLGQVGMWMEDI